MTPALRKFGLLAHVATSAGWLGSVVAFLALAAVGLTSPDRELARAAYLTMNVTASFVIVPLALASLLTGIVQSLGTPWGLFRQYWVVAKLVLTVFATTVLLLKLKPIGELAGLAEAHSFSSAAYIQLRIEVLVHSGGGLIILLAAAALAIYKPWGPMKSSASTLPGTC